MKLRYLAILGLCWMFISAPVFIRADSDPITAADELFSKRMVHENLQQAAEVLTQFIITNPDNVDALWRLARCYWYLGGRASNKENKLNFYTQGRNYAERAVGLNSNEPLGHYWLAALTGSIGEIRGIFQSLAMIGPMKKELEICIQLDPTFADAHIVLAQLYWKAPGPPLSIGNKKKALEEARLAVIYQPGSSEYWLYYGQIAIANKDYPTAREALLQSISLPDDPEEPDQSQKFKAIAAEELKKIEGK